MSTIIVTLVHNTIYTISEATEEEFNALRHLASENSNWIQINTRSKLKIVMNVKSIVAMEFRP